MTYLNPFRKKVDRRTAKAPAEQKYYWMIAGNEVTVTASSVPHSIEKLKAMGFSTFAIANGFRINK